MCHCWSVDYKVMGGGASTRRSYYQHQKPEVFFEVEIYPNLKHVLTLLGLTYEESLQVRISTHSGLHGPRPARLKACAPCYGIAPWNAP
jgi:hypothetical protein